MHDLGPRASAIRFLRETGEGQKARVAQALRRSRRISRRSCWTRPIGRSRDAASIELDGRELRLRYLGRGHTDHDALIIVPDADVLFAGDLLENGATPYFGDGYPMDWPATVEAMLGSGRRCHARRPGTW